MATSLEHLGTPRATTSRGRAASAALAAMLPQAGASRWDWVPRLPGWLDPLSTLIALKTGVGLVIAVTIALWLGWSPTGAAFACIMLQTTYLGRTLGRSVLRAVGALAGGILALTLVATFAQDRVLTISAVALLTGLIIYLEQISRYPYALLFVLLSVNLITFGSIYDPENAFSEALSWVSGNGLGIAIVLIMHGVLWPHTGEKSFEKQLRTFLQGLEHLFALKTAALLHGTTAPDASQAPSEIRALEAHLVAMLAQLRLALGIAARDTDRIARFAPAYEDLIEQLQALTSALIMYGETLGVWRDTPLAEALERQVSTAGALIRTVQAQLGDLVTGFGQARDGSALPHDDDTLGVIKAEVEALRQRLGTRPHSTLEAAAIDGVAEKALETSAAIRTVRHALATLEQPGRPVAAARSGTQIDMITGIRSPALMLQKSAIGMIALTVNSLLWIYLDWPMPSSLLVFVVVPVALNAMVPAFPLIGALKSLLVGPILAAVLYFGVMPQLDGMEQLAPILILFFFPTAYLTNSANPSTMMFGLLSSLWVVSLIDLSEGQVYSFANFANNTIGIIGGVGVGLATLAFINPPRPERQFKTHVRAFLARCERAVQDLAGPLTGRSDPGSTLHARRAEWLELLGMCELWARQLDERRHPAPERARLDAFIGTLWAFAFRLEALARACQRHPDESLIANPAARCRHAIGATLEALRKELATAAPTPSTAISTSIDDFCSALEPLHAQDHASHAIREPLHQALTLTGYYCALSDEAEACRRSAGEIDWRKWDLAYF